MTSAEPDPLILGLDFGGTKIACAVADLAGTPVDQVVIATEPDNGAEQALRRTFAAVDELRSRQPGRLVGVGVSTMGITFEDRTELAPNVAGWSELRMPEMLRTQYPGVNIRIDNDVKAAAFAELTWGALQGADPGIYVNLGSGIAATIISG
ncbi:MAG: ROK family protein, partial [Mycobacterium sp.]|nr:ROK family protein [Mycobacterium sp.]